MKKPPTFMLNVRLTESDLRTLDATVNGEQALRAFSPLAYRRITRSSVVRDAIYSHHVRVNAALDEKEGKTSDSRCSERKGRNPSSKRGKATSPKGKRKKA